MDLPRIHKCMDVLIGLKSLTPIYTDMCRYVYKTCMHVLYLVMSCLIERLLAEKRTLSFVLTAEEILLQHFLAILKRPLQNHLMRYFPCNTWIVMLSTYAVFQRYTVVLSVAKGLNNSSILLCKKNSPF